MPPPSGTFPNSTSQATVYGTLARYLPTLPWQRGHSQIFCESKCNDKAESEVEVFMGMVFFHSAIIEYARGFKWFGNLSLMVSYQFSK